MATTYTVKKGDCLWTIAESKLGDGSRWKEIATTNNISTSNPIIHPGDVLTIPTGAPITYGKNTSSTPKIDHFGLQAGTDSTIFATWKWDKSHTDHYAVRWYYDTGNGKWFEGNSSDVTIKQSVYSAPANAKKVKFKVKPIAKKHKVNGKDTSHWTANWSVTKVYSLKDNPPTKPSSPKVEIDKYKLTASLNNLDVNGTSIYFQVIKDDKSIYKTGSANIKAKAASYSCTVEAGHKYKVRCRACRGDLKSEWTEFSDNIETAPAASKSIIKLKTVSKTEIYISWERSLTATKYEIQYTTMKKYFDSSDQVESKTIEGSGGLPACHSEIIGLETGKEYFFRVRAVNEQGESSWTPIKSIIVGAKPVAPTTWSSTTTVITGEPLKLYWLHNSADGSVQKKAHLEIYIGDDKQDIYQDIPEDDAEEGKTSFYEIDTSLYSEGTQIKWRVCTKGILDEYSDWSIQRTIDIYAPPTLELNVTDSENNNLEIVEAFPFYINGIAGPITQNVISYHISIIANEAYETVDQIGNSKMVNPGEEIYSRNFDISDNLKLEMSASDIDLENNAEYTINGIVSMDSGLTATSSASFVVAWTDEVYEPNAEITVDTDNVSTYIRPYCEDEDGNLIEDISLSVYRRECDGRFVEIATSINNTDYTFVSDPHPALDYARYRIVAMSNATGAISYCDIPGYPIGEKAVIIQWDEDWSSFDGPDEDALENPVWSGSMLKLPYDIDISDNNSADVSLVEYIGRQNPVSYYGTQLGTSSTWSVKIEKDDVETLYALRRLANYMGDVYVREPSGSGYWANISVSFSQTHRELTIPVSLSIKRVEGGV